MRTIERETIITPAATDDGAGAMIGALLGLALLAVLCYFLFFNHTRVVNNTTTVLPAPVTMQAPAPASPATNTTINMPAPVAAPAAAPAAATSSESTTSETTAAPTQSTESSSTTVNQ
jgi:hypothetical protein